MMETTILCTLISVILIRVVLGVTFTSLTIINSSALLEDMEISSKSTGTMALAFSHSPTMEPSTILIM